MSESQQKLPSASYDDEIDLRKLIHVLWAGKWIIGGITFAATAIAVIVALMLPNIYRAEALLVPNDMERAGGLSALAAQYGGLASLVGINLGGGSTDKTTVGLELLRSRKFVIEFIQKHELLVPLMASKSWDKESGELSINTRIFDVEEKKWKKRIWQKKPLKPTLLEAYDEFTSNMQVRQYGDSGFVKVSIDHHSPIIAKQWVDWIIADINYIVMTQEVSEAEQSIEYLKNQIQSTSLAGLHIVFFQLIEKQLETIILSKISDEYLFRTIDPAVVAEEKFRPNRALLCILGLMAGLILGSLVVLWRSNKDAPVQQS